MGAKCARGEMPDYGDIQKKPGQQPEEEDDLEIAEVKNGGSINDLIREVNEVIAGWTENYQPVADARDATKNACGMEKKKKAGVKEALMGLAVTMVSDGNMSQQDL